MTKLDGKVITTRIILAEMVKNGSVIQVGRKFVRLINTDEVKPKENLEDKVRRINGDN